jgi:hypothetical protein
MKKKELDGQIEKLKENIDSVSKKSKETVRSIIHSSSRQLEESFDANKKFIDTLEKHIFSKDIADPSLISEVKKSFSNSVELSEESIDTIIDMQSDQLQRAIDLNVKLLDAIKSLDFSDKEDRQQLLGVIEKNFEESSSGLIENTKKMTEIYNKHVNLAVNFNQKFSKNINHQLQMFNKTQSREMFSDWTTHWWKSSSKEEATV